MLESFLDSLFVAYDEDARIIAVTNAYGSMTNFYDFEFNALDCVSHIDADYNKPLSPWEMERIAKRDLEKYLLADEAGEYEINTRYKGEEIDVVCCYACSFEVAKVGKKSYDGEPMRCQFCTGEYNLPYNPVRYEIRKAWELLELCEDCFKEVEPNPLYVDCVKSISECMCCEGAFDTDKLKEKYAQ